MYVLIEDREELITEKMYHIMHYFKQSQALQPEITHFKLTQSFFTKKIWQTIIQILDKYDYELPEMPKIKSNLPADYLSADFISILQKMRIEEVNNLYLAVHFLKIQRFRKCIAAYYACRVYLHRNFEDFELKASKLGISPIITASQLNQYKQREPSLN